MTQPNDGRFGPFSAVDYNPDNVIEAEAEIEAETEVNTPGAEAGTARGRGGVGIARTDDPTIVSRRGVPGPGIVPASGGVAAQRSAVPQRSLAVQRDVTPARELGVRLGADLEERARTVGPAGSISRGVGEAAALAARSRDPRVAVAGQVIGRAVQAHDVAVANGIDVPGKAREQAARVAEYIRTRPPREHTLFSKLTNVFGNRDNSVPVEGENVARYAERMVSEEFEDRTNADNPDYGTAGMEEFVAEAHDVGDLLDDENIIDGEVLDVTVTDVPVTEAAGGGNRGGRGGTTVRAGNPRSKEIAIRDLDERFDELEDEHQLAITAGVVGTELEVRSDNERSERSQFFPPIDEDFMRQAEAAAQGERIHVRTSGAALTDQMYGNHELTDEHQRMREALQTLQNEAARKWVEKDVKENPFEGKNLDKPASEGVDKLKKSHDMFASAMVMTALAPVRHGVDGESLAAVAGSLAIMWALSPKFRDYTQPFTDKLLMGGEKIAKDKAAKERKGFFFKSVDERKRADAKAQGHMTQFTTEKERMMQSDPKHAPYQVDSAAMQLVSLSNNAYDSCRQNGADVEKILRKYGTMCEQMEDVWREQGLDPAEVNDRARWIVGNEMIKDPKTAARYVNTVSADVVMTDEKVTEGPNGEMIRNWDGQWRDGLDASRRVDKNAPFFIPRAPQTVEQHHDTAHRAMAFAVGPLMSDISSPRDTARIEEVKNALIGFTHTDVTEKIDVAGNTSRTAKSAALAQSLRQAMIDDGVSPADVNRVMESAFRGAVDDLTEAFPKQFSNFERVYPTEALVAESHKYASMPDTYIAGQAGGRIMVDNHMSSGMLNVKEMREQIRREQQQENQNQQSQERVEQSKVQNGNAGTNSADSKKDRPIYEQKFQGERNANVPKRGVVPDAGTARVQGVGGVGTSGVGAGGVGTSSVGANTGLERIMNDDERHKQRERFRRQAEQRSHEAEMREATVGANPGVTTTPAGMDQVESFNNDYDSPGHKDMDLNYDDQTTLEQEDKHNSPRSVSGQRAKNAWRVNAAQTMMEEEERHKKADELAKQAAEGKGKSKEGPEMEM